MEAVELSINVRNKVVHPPNNIRSVEWPSGDELFEAWQLATWYLELGILRLLENPRELLVPSTARWLVWQDRTGPVEVGRLTSHVTRDHEPRLDNETRRASGRGAPRADRQKFSKML
jgi:hypothetical protein